jgi:hypothetical protein
MGIGEMAKVMQHGRAEEGLDSLVGEGTNLGCLNPGVEER